MQYLKAKDGIVEEYPYSVSQLRKDNPNVSFPKEMADEQLANRNVYPVVIAPTPSYDYLVQSVRQDAPQNVNGAWVIAWVVEQLSEDQAELNVRNSRNDLLKDSDWTQVADAPVDKSAWATYRQELRDITGQAGFPYNVIWPTPPA